MKYFEMTCELKLRFPELETDIVNELAIDECYQPGPEVLYQNVLNPYVKKLLFQKNADTEIRKLFRFFEDLAQSKDPEVRNFLQVILLEALWEDKETYEKACKYMLPMTRKINTFIYEYFSLPK